MRERWWEYLWKGFGAALAVGFWASIVLLFVHMGCGKHEAPPAVVHRQGPASMNESLGEMAVLEPVVQVIQKNDAPAAAYLVTKDGVWLIYGVRSLRVQEVADHAALTKGMQ